MTAKQITEEIERIAEVLGKSPTKRDYINHRKETAPSHSTVQRQFGSWNAAKEASYLDTFATNRVLNPTRADCLDALQVVADKIGKSPTMEEYNKNRSEDHPSANTISRNIGWTNAKKSLGLNLLCGCNKKYTEEDCLEAIEQVAEEMDKIPSSRDYNKHRSTNSPSSLTIHERIGWAKAKEKVSRKDLV